MLKSGDWLSFQYKCLCVKEKGYYPLIVCAMLNTYLFVSKISIVQSKSFSYRHCSERKAAKRETYSNSNVPMHSPHT